MLKQPAQVMNGNIAICQSIKNLLKNLVMFSHVTLP